MGREAPEAPAGRGCRRRRHGARRRGEQGRSGSAAARGARGAGGAGGDGGEGATAARAGPVPIPVGYSRQARHPPHDDATRATSDAGATAGAAPPSARRHHRLGGGGRLHRRRQLAVIAGGDLHRSRELRLREAQGGVGRTSPADGRGLGCGRRRFHRRPPLAAARPRLAPRPRVAVRALAAASGRSHRRQQGQPCGSGAARRPAVARLVQNGGMLSGQLAGRRAIGSVNAGDAQRGAQRARHLQQVAGVERRPRAGEQHHVVASVLGLDAQPAGGHQASGSNHSRRRRVRDVSASASPRRTCASSCSSTLRRCASGQRTRWRQQHTGAARPRSSAPRVAAGEQHHGRCRPMRAAHSASSCCPRRRAARAPRRNCRRRSSAEARRLGRGRRAPEDASVARQSSDGAARASSRGDGFHTSASSRGAASRARLAWASPSLPTAERPRIHRAG